jgi:hypothetical protein
MRQRGRGGRCRPRSLGASPRGPTGTYQSLPVRAGLAGARVAAAELPRAAGHVFAASGYQEREDQPLLELINSVVDSAVPVRPAYSSRALHNVADLPAACCACNRLSGAAFRRGFAAAIAVHKGRICASPVSGTPPTGARAGSLTARSARRTYQQRRSHVTLQDQLRRTDGSPAGRAEGNLHCPRSVPVRRRHARWALVLSVFCR